MEIDPAECTLEDGSGRRWTARGQNRCRAADELRYQLCLENVPAEPDQIECRRTGAGDKAGAPAPRSAP